MYLEGGDPLTAEELEEKERLLEDVSGMWCVLCFYLLAALLKLNFSVH